MKAINLKSTGLPVGWVKCALPDFTYLEMGQSPPSKTYNHEKIGLPFFQGKAEFTTLHPAIDKYCSEPTKIARTGATLLSVRAPVGPTNLANIDCCIGRGLAGIHPLGGIEPKFILFLMRSIEKEISDKGTGSTFTAINKAFLEQLVFALPPLNEQKQIVAKIEELFSELDHGIKSLKTACEQLKSYRQSILKHAFEGKLTADWRKQNEEKLETAKQLLERVNRERKVYYQKQLTEYANEIGLWNKDKRGAERPKKPKRLEPISAISSEKVLGLPELPKGWQWASLSLLLSFHRKPMTTGPFGTMLSKNEHTDSGIPVLGIENIGEGKFLYGNKIFVTKQKAQELKSFEVEATDVIISRSGTVGEICEVPENLGKALISTNLLRISLNHDVIFSYLFVLLFHGAAEVKKQIKELCKGSSRDFLNQSILSSLFFPLPSLDEQDVILKQIDSRLSLIEKLEGEIKNAIQKSEALRQSILKKAFSGKLVTQDPNDEPASMLLERIRAEKNVHLVNNKDNHKHEIKPGNAYAQGPLFQETAI